MMSGYGASVYGLSGSVALDGRPLIHAFELALEPGWTCLLGPSGSGKSTLLRLLAGLETRAHFVGGCRVPARIGWMAQDDLLQSRLSVLQNVMLIERLKGKGPNEPRAQRLLAAVGLEGYGPVRPDSLSGGERQRVALARTLMSDAELILLDEPFSALDPATRATMQDLAFEQFAGRSVLLVTHDPGEALRLGSRLFWLKANHLEPLAPLVGSKPHDLGDPNLAAFAARLIEDFRTCDFGGAG